MVIAEFKIGIWNAWIPMLFLAIHPLYMILLDKIFGNGNIFKKLGPVPYQRWEKSVSTITSATLVLLVLYSIFIPLKVGTSALWIGMGIYLVGLALLILVFINIAQTPFGQPFTRGLYRFSRHPMYFASWISLVGVGLASESSVFLVMVLLLIIMQPVQANAEERFCVEKFGQTYKEYMNGTPKWIGLPGKNRT